MLFFSSYLETEKDQNQMKITKESTPTPHEITSLKSTVEKHQQKLHMKYFTWQVNSKQPFLLKAVVPISSGTSCFLNAFCGSEISVSAAAALSRAVELCLYCIHCLEQAHRLNINY